MFRHLFHYEHRSEPLLPWRLFLLRRVGKTAAAATAVIAISLVLGMLGYRLAEGMGWLDAFLNASMILGGMGPVDPVHSAAGKWFESLYALFSGVAFLTCVGIFLAPLAHRILHRFHLEKMQAEDEQ